MPDFSEPIGSDPTPSLLSGFAWVVAFSAARFPSNRKSPVVRVSHLLGARKKERPSEATLESHALLLRGGYVRQVAGGIYSLLPPAVRVVRKIEQILRDEMNRVGGQEVLMPVVLPRELWEESGRYQGVGRELLRVTDRTDRDLLLAMTHEEAVVHLSRNEVNSYSQLPFMVYQIQTKFRDEPRSRGGLIRVREFTMKDAYSFHTSDEDLEGYYQQCYHAYERIFARAGLPEVVAVESDTGMMGGKVAHEFMLLTDGGEDTIVTSDDGKYLANQEVAVSRIEHFKSDSLPLEKVHTPGQKTIEDVAKFIGVPTRQTAKAVLYETDRDQRFVMAVVRGDREVNEVKLSKIVGDTLFPAREESIAKTPIVAGYASPIGLVGADGKTAGVEVVVDVTVRESSNLVTGANEVDYHFKNFNLERDAAGAKVADIVAVAAGDGSPVSDGKIELKRGVEVGNIFQLGTKYSAAMSMTYDDESGKRVHPTMGCYGIGVGRLMASVIESRHDKFGPIWPLSIAPWQVHICALKPKIAEVKETAERLYEELQARGVEVILDDTGHAPGYQFGDADLIGVPFRLIVSERNLKEGQVEWKRRDGEAKGMVAVDEAVASVETWIRDELARLERVADEIPEA